MEAGWGDGQSGRKMGSSVIVSKIKINFKKYIKINKIKMSHLGGVPSTSS